MCWRCLSKYRLQGENLQANVELTYFTSAYIILGQGGGLTVNPNKRKHSSSRSLWDHGCRLTKPQPTIDPLKRITSRWFNMDRLPTYVKVTGLIKHEVECELNIFWRLIYWLKEKNLVGWPDWLTLHSEHIRYQTILERNAITQRQTLSTKL